MSRSIEPVADTRAPIAPRSAPRLTDGPREAGTPLVSVVIASYDMVRYLPLAVRSALAQSWTNLEVVVVDDGSTDDTASVVEALADEDCRVRYLYQRNAGQAAAKNRGIREARGDYIAFLDADDYWAREKLALQLPLLMSSDRVGVVYSRYRHVDESGSESRISDNTLFRGRITESLFVRNFVSFGTAVVRRECFERLGGFDESLRMGIDYDLWLRVSTQYEFDYVDLPLLYYRRWSGQMSNDGMNRYLCAMRIMKRFLAEYPGVVGKRSEAEGWADTYVNFGFCVWEAEGRRASGLKMFVRALRHKVDHLPAWRALIVSALHLT